MPLPDRPCLRRFLVLVPDARDPRSAYLLDRLPWGTDPVRLTRRECEWLRWFDGQHTLRDIQAAVIQHAHGVFIPLEPLVRLTAALDEALYLEGARFQAQARAWAQRPVRPPACIGCYEADPQALREQLEHLFAGPNGPGLPRSRQPSGRLRAALLPHIDFARGGATFAWGFKEVFERTDAALFVILGTSHYSPSRYILTRMNFETPLGVVPTDPQYVERLVTHYGDGLFADEIAHLPEHSIELEVVFLHYYYARRRPIRIVPLLVGSFQDSVEAGRAPSDQPDVQRMIRALQQVEAETREPICYLISGDLAHIGPKFDDPEPVAEPFLAHSRQQDYALLRNLEAADLAGYFRVLAAEGDRRRVCGLPPTYTTLAAARPCRGRVLHYDQYVEPQGYESVSFASVAFE